MANNQIFTANIEKTAKRYEDAKIDINAVESALYEIAVKAQNTLQNKSKKRTGEYAASWEIEKEPTGSNLPDFYIVKDKDKYFLTHLLELGHKLRDGSYLAGDYLIRRTQKTAKTRFKTAMKKLVMNDLFK